MASKINDDERMVFIAVYQSQGGKISNWEALMASLPKLVMGRCVYKCENTALAWLERAEVNLNEGFVVAKVKVDKIRVTNKQDSIGQRIFSIEKGDLQPEDIHRFVHATGKIYNWQEEKLLLCHSKPHSAMVVEG